jgi:hypothetical protein
MLMAAVMAQRRTQVRERLWQLDAMRTRCHHKGQTSPQGGDPSHRGDDHVVSPSPRFPSLLFLSSPRAICSVLFPSCKPPRRTARYTHRGPKEGIRGLPRPSSQVLQSLSGPWTRCLPSTSILPLLIPGRGNAGPSASGGCTPKRYWPCICPRCALITSQGFFGCAREKLPIARLWADANSPGQLHPKAGRGWRQVTFAPRRV